MSNIWEISTQSLRGNKNRSRFLYYLWNNKIFSRGMNNISSLFSIIFLREEKGKNIFIYILYYIIYYILYIYCFYIIIIYYIIYFLRRSISSTFYTRGLLFFLRLQLFDAIGSKRDIPRSFNPNKLYRRHLERERELWRVKPSPVSSSRIEVIGQESISRFPEDMAYLPCGKDCEPNHPIVGTWPLYPIDYSGQVSLQRRGQAWFPTYLSRASLISRSSRW